MNAPGPPPTIPMRSFCCLVIFHPLDHKPRHAQQSTCKESLSQREGTRQYAAAHSLYIRRTMRVFEFSKGPHSSITIVMVRVRDQRHVVVIGQLATPRA